MRKIITSALAIVAILQTLSTKVTAADADLDWQKTVVRVAQSWGQSPEAFLKEAEKFLASLYTGTRAYPASVKDLVFLEKPTPDTDKIKKCLAEMGKPHSDADVASLLHALYPQQPVNPIKFAFPD